MYIQSETVTKKRQSGAAAVERRVHRATRYEQGERARLRLSLLVCTDNYYGTHSLRPLLLLALPVRRQVTWRSFPASFASPAYSRPHQRNQSEPKLAVSTSLVVLHDESVGRSNQRVGQAESDRGCRASPLGQCVSVLERW